MSSVSPVQGGFARFVLLLTFPVVLAGCSDMKFVSPTASTPDAHDPRRDVQLTGVTTTMTSGSTLLRRVSGESGIYSEDRGVVLLDKAHIETFRPNGSVQGITAADQARIYLADQPTSTALKRDMEFAGNFHHRSPAETDPTTDALQLRSQALRWDEQKQVFECPSPYKMVTSQPGRGPMVLAGSRFVATRDLKSFKMGGASVCNDPAADPRKALEPLGRDIQEQAESMAARYKMPPLPTPIVVETPTSDATPNIPSMIKQAEQLRQATGTPTPAAR